MQLTTGICRPRRLHRTVGVALAGALCVAAAAAPTAAWATGHGTPIVTTTASGLSILETARHAADVHGTAGASGLLQLG
jgi:hypothetical protein